LNESNDSNQTDDGTKKKFKKKTFQLSLFFYESFSTKKTLKCEKAHLKSEISNCVLLELLKKIKTFLFDRKITEKIFNICNVFLRS
jgi:hypothetical protein